MSEQPPPVGPQPPMQPYPPQQPYGAPQQPYPPQQSYGGPDQPYAAAHQTFPQPQAPMQAPPPPPGYGYGAPQPQRTNTMAILGLVFAFIVSPLGIVFSAMGLKQTRERGEGGRGLALAGMILSIIFTLLWVVYLVLAVTVLSTAVRSASAIDAAASSASKAVASANSQALASESAALSAAQQSTGPADAAGVAAACHVIVPAAANSDIGSATNVEEYQAELGALMETLSAAAATTSDASFIADVQKLVDDFQAVSDAVGNGQDPSGYEGALTADGSKIDEDCAAVGVTG